MPRTPLRDLLGRLDRGDLPKVHRRVVMNAPAIAAFERRDAGPCSIPIRLTTTRAVHRARLPPFED